MNRHARQGLVCLAVSATAAVGLAAVLASPVRAAVTFTGVASAYGIDSTTSNPSVPLGLVVQAAGPAAQAILTSLQQSDTFASVPYPGEKVTGLPGIAGGAAGVPLPDYPFIVTTSLGQEPEQRSFGVATLSGESTDDEARATAETGSNSSGYTATARVTRGEDDGVVAVAEARLSGVKLSGAVSVDGVRAVARVERDPQGRLTRKASTSIGSLVVPALELVLPPQLPAPFGGMRLEAPRLSFTDGQFRVFLPGLGEQSQPVPANTVLNALAAAGIEASYQKSTQSPDGVFAPTLTLRTRLPSPPPNQVANGVTDLAVTLGRAHASIGYAVVREGEAPPPAVLSDTAGAPGPQSDATGASQEPGGAFDSGRSSPVAPPGFVPGREGVAAPPMVAAPAAQAAAAGGRVPLRRLPDLYLVLVLAAVAVFGAGQATRLLAVRSA